MCAITFHNNLLQNVLLFLLLLKGTFIKNEIEIDFCFVFLLKVLIKNILRIYKQQRES